MATIKWNPATANSFLVGTSAGAIIFSGNPAGATVTQVLGSPNITVPASTLFIFKGTMPSDFSTVSNIASQSGNLLISLPVLGVSQIGQVSDSLRFLTGTSGGTYSASSNATVTAGNLVVTSANHSFIPGQTVTLTGLTGGANLNATWTIESTPNANAWVSTATTGSAGTASGTGTGGTTTFSYTAQASGTASWFILARWTGSGTGTTTATSLANIGALMGNIGVTGSSSDLEIPSTTITSGSTYSSAGFYLNWPLTWTV